MTWTTLSFPYGSTLSSSQMTNLVANFTAMGNGDSGAPRISGAGINAWPFPFGVGSRTTETIASDTWKLRGCYEYEDFTLSAGAVLSISNSNDAAFIAFVRGTARIHGSINLTGQGGKIDTAVYSLSSPNVQPSAGSLGGGGGGAGDGRGAGGAGAMWTLGGISSPGLPGTAGTSPSNRVEPMLWRNITNLRAGTGGGSGGGYRGGNGGGAIVIVCDKLDFTGSLICDGADAGASYNDAGYGGGGGGAVILMAREIISNTGSMSVLGGAKSTSIFNGGDGADGYAEVVVYSR